MKNFTCVFLTFLCVLAFAACAGNKLTGGASTELTSESDITQEGGFSEAISDESVPAVYTIEKIEKRLSYMNDLKDFICYRIAVDTCNCLDHNSIITFFGDCGGEKWSKNYTISYGEFLELYDDETPFIVYNTLSDDFLKRWCQTRTNTSLK